ncbi:MAG: TolC family outer membrane protein [Gammaproteobacteria bacterium]|nr:TolC family outer membrane protein [Gammaproteobacteria bacterium]
MRTIVLTLISCLVFLPHTDVFAADLWTVYQMARENDPSLKSSYLTYLAEQQRIPIARSGLLPTLDLAVGKARNRDELSSDAPFISEGSATFGSDEAGLRLRQPVYDRGARIELKQARDQVSLAELEFAAAQQDLILKVADRYFLVLTALDNVEVSRKEKIAIAEQLELARQRLEVGLGTTTDLFDAEARFQLAEADEIQALNLLEDARQALTELTGQVTGELVGIRPGTSMEAPQPTDIDHWVALALKQNLRLLIERQSAEVAMQEIKLQRAARLPTVDFIIDHVHNNTDGSIAGAGVERDNTDAILQLTLPLYQGGEVTARTREATLRYEAALESVEREQRSAERGARDAYLGVTSGIRRVTALAQAVTAQESAVEAKKQGFAAGLNTSLDVLDAERDLGRAKRDHLIARLDYILSFLRLWQVAGSLGEKDLQNINSRLQ